MKAKAASAIAACIVMAGASPPARAQQPSPPEYRLKHESPPTGTNIPPTAASWNLPLNKTHEELSPEERARLHSWYRGLKEGDEPPFPLRGMRPVMRDIIDVQRHALVRGDARYGVRVDAKGVPQAIAVYESPAGEFIFSFRFNVR